MDFLIETLDAWEDAEASGDPSVPRYRVMIQALGGASAGAMTAAVAAVALNSEVDPVRDIGTPPAAERNRLFDAWVRQITAKELLGDADLIPADPPLGVAEGGDQRRHRRGRRRPDLPQGIGGIAADITAGSAKSSDQRRLRPGRARRA